MYIKCTSRSYTPDNGGLYKKIYILDPLKKLLGFVLFIIGLNKEQQNTSNVK